MRFFAFLALLLCFAIAGCGSNGEHYTGDVGDAYRAQEVRNYNSQQLHEGSARTKVW